MPIGGSKFELEKTWRATGVGTTTFNTPGNFTIPYGKQSMYITGKGVDGLAASVASYTPGTLASYNPGTVAAYTPGSVASYTPGTLAGYVPGNIAYYNPGSSGNYGFSYNYNVYVVAGEYYIYGYFAALCCTGSVVAFCPPYAVSCTCYVPGNPYYTPGNAVYNADTPYYNSPTAASYNAPTVANYNAPVAAYNTPTPATYNAATTGASSSAFGFTFPGGVSVPATTIGPFEISYNTYPDNQTYPVTVPSGGSVQICSK